MTAASLWLTPAAIGSQIENDADSGQHHAVAPVDGEHMVNIGADMVIAFERGFAAELFMEETLGAVAVETEFFMAVQAGLKYGW